MIAKAPDNQQLLFSAHLEQILNHAHPLFKLANAIDWSEFEQTFGKFYSPDQGRPAKPIRLMVGLHYLKHTFDLSDEEVVARWVENPYWQYFCGERHFQHELPIEPSLMTKWRNKVKERGMEKLLEVTIKTGLKTGALKKAQLKKVCVDTTVQEKAISFPTDAKLYHRMRQKLIKKAKASGMELRQTYVRKSKQALVMHSRLARNYLLGSEGDRVNAILCGCGYNIRRLLRAIIFWLWRVLLFGRFCHRGALTIMTDESF